MITVSRKDFKCKIKERKYHPQDKSEIAILYNYNRIKIEEHLHRVRERLGVVLNKQ